MVIRSKSESSGGIALVLNWRNIAISLTTRFERYRQLHHFLKEPIEDCPIYASAAYNPGYAFGFLCAAFG